jgi:hypothetical protein
LQRKFANDRKPVGKPLPVHQTKKAQFNPKVYGKRVKKKKQ